MNSTGTTITCHRIISPTELDFTSILATGNADDDVLYTAGLSPGNGAYIKLDPSDNVSSPEKLRNYQYLFL